LRLALLLYSTPTLAPRLGQVVLLYALYILLAAPLANSAALLAGGTV
jgi:hypothetical protein